MILSQSGLGKQVLRKVTISLLSTPLCLNRKTTLYFWLILTPPTHPTTNLQLDPASPSNSMTTHPTQTHQSYSRQGLNNDLATSSEPSTTPSIHTNTTQQTNAVQRNNNPQSPSTHITVIDKSVYNPAVTDSWTRLRARIFDSSLLWKPASSQALWFGNIETPNFEFAKTKRRIGLLACAFR